MGNPKNTLYTNFVLENMIEELVASQLDLQSFVSVDNNLVGTPGMQIKINRYTATDATQNLTIGDGNTASIVASYTPETYNIKLAQNRFEYYDEEADSAVARLVAMLEPVMIIIMGVAVCMLLLAVFPALYGSFDAIAA